ncbi:pyruvate-formate lyase-activating enzyme [Marinitoga piezophila KA3]|uniref:Pyruvate-formate lyase-activating enzyme n=1 Tax=Marinitoga piezophila (strain DSM 14283 / JCM 11233 / KA3) TaxID=443254 RepID=H2J3A6_MARPK|nr:AmmeMemoRadiSam system radical SAM enzyme [Marinitoga piezophila]AEX85722.1 pyruvate-formate lyase-activating enzyme [Marinitoga piezophila KA3]
MKEALYYKTLENNKVQCTLCPHNCIIKNSSTGICRVRKNVDGKLYTLNYGEITAIANDPIEKKPLFHFHPGENIISIGTWGCNFRCKFCQNFEISQESPWKIYKLTPQDILNLLLENHAKMLAFTYSEPNIWYEFVLDTAKLVKKHGIKTVMVTNGYISEKPLMELLPYIDAMNIDLKGFNNEFYAKIIGGKKEPVMNTIKLAYNFISDVEITTLIVTEGNDDEREFTELVKWISSISKNIPLHISRYYPVYKYNKPPTPIETLKKFYEIARKHLNFVYLGNVRDKQYESTYCPYCKTMLIKREGYNIEILNVDEKGRCKNCLKKIPIIF